MNTKNICFHCGLPVLTNTYTIKFKNEKKYVCCPGCLAVSKFILDNGFEDYYENRNTYSAKIDTAFLKNKFLMYDNKNISKKFINKQNADFDSIILSIDGITCTACTWLIERYIGQLKGIHKISINLMTCRANIVLNLKDLTLSSLLAEFLKIGYKAYPYNLKLQEKKNKTEFKKELKKIIISGLGMMQIMMLSASLYVGEFKDMHHTYWLFIRWICFIITVPVIFYSGRSIFYSSYRNIKNKTLGMDFTIALSLLIAFTASCYNLLINNGEIYFDSVCMFIFFLLLGRFLEMRARHHAEDIISSLQKINESIAIKITNNKKEEILVEDIKINDILLIKPGDFIPVDGKILEGKSYINESMLTGEAKPIYKNVGTKVIGGTTNIDNILKIKATHTYKHSTISLIIKMLENINSSKPKINIIANKVANYFIIFVLILTCCVSIIWFYLGYDNIINILLSILVVTCPCALSLATPIAVTTSTNALMKLGFLITKENTLNTLTDVTDIVFDKTGTLTKNYFLLNKIKINKNISLKKIISIVLELEKYSNHPISKAFSKFNHFNNEATSKKNTIIKNYVGLGIEGKIGIKTYRFGKRKFIESWIPDTVEKPLNFTEKYSQYLADKNGIIAYFDLKNPLRNNVKKLIQSIKNLNLNIHILSGDSSPDVHAIAADLNISNRHNNMTVKEKVNYIKNLIKEKKIIMMIGDGINDAPALNTSHISVAMGSGTDLAKISADTILLNNDLLNILKAINQSKKTKKIIKQNLLWAIIYNFTGLFLASLNLITPYYAAIGMSTSSLIVVLNSLRLKK